MELGLQDKVVLVTGSGGGIGRTIASSFAAEGAVVAVNDVNDAGIAETVRQIESSGGRAIAAHFDITDLASTRAMAACCPLVRRTSMP